MGSYETSTRVLWGCGTLFKGERERPSCSCYNWTTLGQLLDIFNDASDAKELELELAALIDGGSHFVTATYYLEGDGPLIFSFYERLASVSHSVAVDAYPT